MSKTYVFFMIEKKNGSEGKSTLYKISGKMF